MAADADAGEPIAQVRTPLVRPSPLTPLASIHHLVGGSTAGRARVEVSIHDLQGRTVRVLERAERMPGTYHVSWDARDPAGDRRLPAICDARLKVGALHGHGRMAVLRSGARR